MEPVNDQRSRQDEAGLDLNIEGAGTPYAPVKSNPVFNPVERLIVYVKTWCPWCVAARKVLDERGYAYEVVDVEASKEAYAEMIRISGQRLTPTLVVGDKVLPDFGPEELLAFLDQHGIKP